MKKMMKVAQMTELMKTEIIQREIPIPADDEVLIKVEYVGVCGSDLHYYETGVIGPYVVEPPFVLGHEVAGVVIRVGRNVNTLKIGDRVALEPGKTCGKCEFCTSGLYNLCSDVEFFATPPFDGTLCEYVAHPANLSFKLPDNVSSLAGCLIEPYAVGLHALTQGNAKFGDKVVIFGSGCIGIVSAIAAYTKGVRDIIVVDIVDKRLEKAKQMGATHVINAKKEDTIKRIMEITGGKGADIAIETAGTQITTNQCIACTKKGATIVLVGYTSNGKVNMDVSLALDKELTFKTVFRYRHIYPLAIESVEKNNIQLENLATNIFDFDDISNALEKSISDKVNIVKAVIKM